MGIFLMMKSRATILVALLILSPSIALAQDALETLRAMNLRAAKLASPSLFGIPSAGTMGHRRSFVAGSAATQSRTDTGDLKLDASAALGLGLAMPLKQSALMHTSALYLSTQREKMVGLALVKMVMFR